MSHYPSEARQEFLNRTAGHAQTDDPIVSVISVQDLADYLRAESTDPVLPMVAKQATGMAIRFLGYDLTPRTWTLTHNEWPTLGTMTSPTLSGHQGGFRREIDLPYGRIIDVNSVELYGVPTSDVSVRRDSIVINNASPRLEPSAAPAIVVEYEAGFSPIPDEIKESVLQLAAYLYMNRGCGLDDALTKSGARQALQPWRNPREMVL